MALPWREGKKRTFKNLEFYACNGMVRIHNKDTGQSRDVTCTTFLERAFSLAAAIEKISSADKDGYKERQLLTNMANDCEATAKEAAEMGDPTDPEVQAFYARHKAWKSPSVQVPGLPGGWGVSRGGLIIPQ